MTYPTRPVARAQDLLSPPRPRHTSSILAALPPTIDLVPTEMLEPCSTAGATGCGHRLVMPRPPKAPHMGSPPLTLRYAFLNATPSKAMALDASSTLRSSMNA